MALDLFLHFFSFSTKTPLLRSKHSMEQFNMLILFSNLNYLVNIEEPTKLKCLSHLFDGLCLILLFIKQEWSYLRGGLTTLDRDYGWVNNIHHDIGTHVIHHLFPQIPHYHLVEAVSIT